MTSATRAPSELDAEQLHLLQLFAVAHEPLHLDEVLSYLQRSVLFAVKPLPTRKHVRDQIEALANRRELLPVDVNGARMRIQSRRQHALLEHLRAQGTLAELALEVQRFTPLRLGYPLNTARVARDMLLALYLEPTPNVDTLLDRVHGPYRVPQQAQATLLDALSVDPPAWLLRKLGTAHAESYLESLWPQLVAQLAPVPEGPFEYVRDEQARLPALIVAHCAFALAQQDLYDAAERVLGTRTEPEIEASRAFLALCKRDVDEARACAVRALEASRDRKGQLRGVRGLLGPWIVLLLATASSAEMRSLASQQLGRAERDAQLRGLEQEYAPLRAFLVFLDGGQVFVPSHSFEYSEWQACILSALLARYIGTPLDKIRRGDLAVVAHVAGLRGAPWVARAVASFAEGAPDQAGLIGLYEPEAAWERALSALGRAMTDLEVERTAPRKEDREERVVYVLRPNGATQFTLLPRVQTRKGRGFSAGRAVSWKKLMETARDAALFDEHDRKVLSHVVLDREGGYGSGSYVPEPGAALALVGHPRVFASEDAKEPLEVVRGTVRIDVIERAGEITVRLHPEACALSPNGVIVDEDAPGRLAVYALTDDQRKVALRLGQHGLRVPEGGRGRVEQLLGKLVDLFPVTSDVAVDASALPEVEADSRLHVQLWRRGQGLSARIVVQPLGSGPTFAPGQGTKSVLGTRPGENGPERVRTTRDLEHETARKDALFEAAPTLTSAEQQGRDYVLQDALLCLELLTELHRLKDELILSWPEGTPLSIAGEADAKNLSLRLESSGDWLKADGEIVVDETLKLSLAVLLEKSEHAEGRFIALDDQRFLALSDALKKRLDSLRALSEQQKDGVALHPLAAIDLASWTHELGDFTGDARISQRLDKISQANALTPQVPAQLDAELRAYQEDGYAWLARLAHWGGGACLADDMGLGKTLQTLALLLDEAPRGPALVVAPLSVCSNWREEAARFAPALRVRFLRASEADALTDVAPYDLVVTSYGVMQQQIERLEKVHFRTLVLDEAQAIKNAGALRTRAAFKLHGDVRIALTGTPVENHLGELWSIMTFLNPGLLGSAKGFEERFVKPIQRDHDRSAQALLRRIVRPFVLRRRKSDVLDDLPTKTVITHRIPPSAEERALYQALRENALKKLTDRTKPAETRMRLLAELMRMRRAACHPSLVSKDAAIESSKLEVFESLLAELREGGHRALVFSQFVDYLTIVRKRLDTLGVPYQYLDGSTPLPQRERAVTAFQRGEGDVFLISLKAGGFGLNLTSADYVFHLDPWWNPAVEDQASDRAHRMGQTRPVTIYRLVMEGSIEEKILALHTHKRDLADQLLEGTSEGGTLDVDELMALIRDAS